MSNRKKIQWKLFNSSLKELHFKADLKGGGFRYKVTENGKSHYFDDYAQYRNRNLKN